MKILLINPIIGKNEPSRFPLGLGYIAKVLIQGGHEISVIDNNANRFSREVMEKKIEETHFDVVGLTGLITEYKQIKWISSFIKKKNQKSKIILGGGLGSAVPELILKKTEVDIIVLGEGEVTIIDLINNLEKKKNRLKNVDGIYFKENGKIYCTKPRKQLEDLDVIPFPERSIFPMEKYIKGSHLRLFDSKIKTTNMITSRGCPYNCVFCFKGTWGNKLRQRTPKNIIDEINLLKDKYHIRGIEFNDDTFILDRKRVVELCELIIKEKMDILWLVNGRVNLVDKELLKLMNKAGCKIINYGIESGSQEILNQLKKNVTVEQAKKAVEETWKAGILPHGYIMIGMFGETEKTVNDTVKFCNETGLIGQFSVTTPMPGTELYNLAKMHNKLKYSDEWLLENWPEWGNKVLVNLTDMTDEQLLIIKKKSERKIMFGNLVKNVYRHYKIIKLRNLLREGLVRAKAVL